MEVTLDDVRQARQRRKNFHAEIARKAAVLNPPKPVLVTYVPPEPEKKVISLADRLRQEAAWEVSICGRDPHQEQRKTPYRRTLSPRVLAVVSREYGISIELLTGKRRGVLSIVRARQIAMYLFRTLTNGSYPEIGRRLGGRDHSTVIHGIRMVESRMAADPEFSAEIQALKEMLA